MAGKHYTVYILWSDHVRRFYIGVSEDVAKRLRQHNEGFPGWTRGRGPWRLVWTREFPDLTAGRRFENLLKRQKGARGFFRLTGLDVADFPREQAGS